MLSRGRTLGLLALAAAVVATAGLAYAASPLGIGSAGETPRAISFSRSARLRGSRRKPATALARSAPKPWPTTP